MYIDTLGDIVNKYNNTYHSTIKKKPVDVKSNTYIISIKEINYEDSKFKIGDFVKLSKYQSIFAKGYVPNWSEEDLVLKKLKKVFPDPIFKAKKLLQRFSKRNCKKQIKKSVELKK